MKVSEVLDIRCDNKENKKAVNSFLWKIKPMKNICIKNNYTETQIVPVELLEKCLHGLLTHYNYRTQGIGTYYEDNKFIYFSVSVIRKKDNQWIGYVYGLSLWEVVAKTIIKVYADIMQERKKNGE